ncbi:MAG: N-acetyltransferase family protein [Nocardioides sp.]
MPAGPQPMIRPATLADAEPIALVTNLGWRDTYAGLVPERFYDEAALAGRRSMWTQVLSGAEVPPRLRVAEIEGSVVGFAVARQSDELDRVRGLQLNAIYVRSEYHGTGVGSRLLDAVLGGDPAQLWVAKDNPRAHAFYRKHGFHPDGAEQIDENYDGLVEVRFVR